ncbi:MAG: ATP-grasp domain-containing protein [Oscillospiraceae bacterium]|nr:ATP-grasp domain-containing protein [Oscillospiraceae bacterium]
MGETAFLPLLFGGDINVYSVARAFYEGYGIRPVAYGKFGASVCADSDIVDYKVKQDIENPAVLCGVVVEYAAAHRDKTVLAMGCGDSYVRILAEHREELPPNVVAPYISGELMNTLGNKESFYEVCDQYGLPHPATFIYKPDMGDDFELPFEPPYICKAANDVAYWAHPFEGNRKGFVLQSREELLEVLHKIYAAGYPDDMILQEFIPGDDTHMRVLTSYSGKDGKVKLMCLGHVLLEEHNPHGVGNYAVIQTTYEETVCQRLRSFLEAVGYVGFSNIDMKYDERDGKYKLFEVNCRQGRSNYYVTGAGHNIARLLVEDWIEGKELPFTITKEKSLFMVVPKKVAFDYIDLKYHGEMKELLHAGAVNNPLFCPQDKSFSHRLRIWKNHWRNYGLFRQYAEKKR